MKYLGRAYAIKGDTSMATSLYAQSGDLASIEYPRYPPNGEDSSPARTVKDELRAEMHALGLDETVIR